MELFKLQGTIEVDNKPANKALDETGQKGDKAQSKLSKAFSGIGKAALQVGKIVGTGMVAAGTAVAGLATKAIQSYADYEQLVGGVETLFGAGGKSIEEYAASVGKSVEQVQAEYDKLMSSQSTVLSNATQAYKTAGLSMNEYMETVTSFSASLLQSLGGDTVKAAEVADRAIIDMSDNANKMGTSMELIQNAYNGFAKGNFTMLDNLKLGYGGTGEEMKRLIKDAAALKDVQEELGVTVDANSDSFGNIVNAISVMQKSMGIAGTTAKEAASTISGSLGMMKSSWQNLLTAVADDEAPFDDYINSFVESVTAVTGNLMPRIEVALNGVVNLVNKLAPVIMGKVPQLFSSLLPSIVNAATGLISSIVGILPGAISTIMSMLPALIQGMQSVINALITALPQIVQALVSALPTLIPLLVDALVSLIVTLCTMLPQIIQPIIDNLPMIITSIVSALLANLPVLIQGVIQLVGGLIAAFPQVLVALWEAIKGIFTELGGKIGGFFEPVKNAISNAWAAMGSVPGLAQLKTMIEQVWGAIKSFITTVINAIKNVVTTVWNSIKNVVMTIVTGIKDTISSIWNAIKTIISSVMKIIVSILKGDWEGVKSAITNIVSAIQNVITTIWNSIKNVISSILNGIKNIVSSIWNAIKSVITSAVNSIKAVVTSVFNGIKSAISTVFNGIKSTASSAWNDIKNKMIQPIENAKEKIRGIVSSITSFFNNMQIRLPHIKLPHFRVSGTLSINPPSVPHLSIDWYKKAMNNPMIMDTPTIFGYNPATRSFMAGGEAGSEVVSGTSTLMGMIQGAVSSQNEVVVYYLQKLIEILAVYFPQVLELQAAGHVIEIDGKRAAKILAKPMDDELGKIHKNKERGQ